MKGKGNFSLYQKYHTSRNDERDQLFEILKDRYNPNKCLYPGCFVHITPAFFFINTTFVDTEKRAQEFFVDPQVQTFLIQQKRYSAPPQMTFIKQNYTQELPISADYDLLISQYAGFVSKYCKKYLRKGGYLVTNNSHGDASLTSIDDDFRFVAAINRRGERFWLAKKPLDDWFVPKKTMDITPELILEKQRGIGYTISASNYIFEKVR